VGFLDKAKGMAGDAADKASDLKDQVPTDKVDEAVDAVKDKIPGADKMPGADKIPGFGDSEQAAEPRRAPAGQEGKGKPQGKGKHRA
jgi:hypothetical protein